MSHTCDACVVTCEDFRLHRRADGRNTIGDFVASLGCDCDVITRGGGIQDIVRPADGFDSSLLRDLTVSVGLHSVKTIYLINHTTCGAYGPMGFDSIDAERAQHNADLVAAAKILTDRFPDIEVVTMVAELVPGSDDTFVIA